jgi:osmotically-inducible protein OsmY
MAEEGCAVALFDMLDEPGQALATNLVGRGVKARYWHWDVSREAQGIKVQGVFFCTIHAIARASRWSWCRDQRLARRRHTERPRRRAASAAGRRASRSRPKGVRDVRNTVVVHPDVAPDAVAKTIGRAFHRNAALERDKIHVEVDGSIVTLSGKAQTWRGQDVAEQAAWPTPGVTQVVNNIQAGV